MSKVMFTVLCWLSWFHNAGAVDHAAVCLFHSKMIRVAISDAHEVSYYGILSRGSEKSGIYSERPLAWLLKKQGRGFAELSFAEITDNQNGSTGVILAGRKYRISEKTFLDNDKTKIVSFKEVFGYSLEEYCKKVMQALPVHELKDIEDK